MVSRASISSQAWAWGLLVWAFVLGACGRSSEPAQGAACVPACAGECGAPDGCGGLCPCSPEEPSACADSCESKGRECGEVCGESCGQCDEDEACQDGKCVCVPSCDGTRCDDGCGGVCDCAAGSVCDGKNACVAPEACTDTCEALGKSCGEVCGKRCGECGEGEACLTGQCVDAAGCKDCALHLTVLDRKLSGNHLTEVTLAVEYSPSEGSPRPRMADLRVRAGQGMELVEAAGGAALDAADKALYVDELSKKPFKLRADGAYQLLAYGFANTRAIEAGRLATLTFRGDALGPVSFSLVRRDQTFAPSDADQLLQSSPYDQAVVVSR